MGLSRHKSANILSIHALALFLAFLCGPLARDSRAQNPWAYAYDGRLLKDKQFADGFYDFRFQFFNAETQGQSVGDAITRDAVGVSSGQFRAKLDLPVHAANLSPLWLEVAVRDRSAPAGEWVALSPRRAIEPAPTAIVSQTALAVAEGAVTAQSLSDAAVTARHIQAASISREHLAPGASVTSLNGLSDNPAITAGPGINVMVQGSSILIGLAETPVVAPFEVTGPTGVARSFTDLREAFAAVESGSELLIRSNYITAPRSVWEGSNPSLAGLALVGKERVRIRGVNFPILSATSFGDLLYIRDCKQITVEGLVFDGSGVTTAGEGHPYAALLNLGGTNLDIAVRGSTFQNFPGHGVSHLWSSKTSTHVRITRCTFENLGNPFHPKLNIDGAAISGIGSHWLVAYNRIRDCLRGIEIEGPGPAPMSNIIISENHLESIWNEGIVLYASTGHSGDYTDIIIKNNIVSGTETLADGVPVQTGISINGGERVTVSANHVHGFPKAIYGIGLTGAMAPIRDSIIKGNTVSGIGYRGIQAFGTSFEAENVLIADNQVRDTHEGILVGGRGHSVRGNIVRSSKNKAIRVGEWPSDLALEITVSDNIISGNEGVGIAIEEGAAQTSIHNNRFLQNTSGNVLNVGVNTELSNNRFR